MGDDVNVDLDGLRRTRQQLGEAKGKMRSHHEAARLRGRVGHGPIGELFQGIAQRTEKVVEDVTGTVVKSLEDTEKGLLKVEEQTLKDEAEAKQAFDKLGRRPHDDVHARPGVPAGGTHDEPPVTAYRAQGGSGRDRILVDEETGNVTLTEPPGRKRKGVVLHLGFDEERAQVWLSDKGRTQVVQFDVHRSFLDRLRATAVGENEPHDRTVPWRVDVDWKDQYAIPPALFDELRRSIVQGSGKVLR